MIHGAICGKFRILHIAHKELMLQAIGKVDHLHVFLCDVHNIKRYATIKQTYQAIHEILSKYNTPFSIHILSNDELEKAPAPSVLWDQLLLSKAPDLNVVFDSKEIYGNTLINNEYIPLFHSKKISASDIEKNPYQLSEAILIAPEFIQYMQKKVAILNTKSDNAQLLHLKLNDFFATAYIPRLSITIVDDEQIDKNHFDLILTFLSEQKQSHPLFNQKQLILSTTSKNQQFIESINAIQQLFSPTEYK